VIGPDNIVQKRTVTVGSQVWRTTQGSKEPGWTLTNTTPESKTPTAPVRSVVAITSGLEPGDRVIAIGLLRARPGAAVTPEDWNFKAP